MAQEISSKKDGAQAPTQRKKYGQKPQKEGTPLFRKTNYILMIIGAIILVVGYLALTGGASDDPNKFSEAIFDTRRLVVAPILMLAGLVIEIVAIMWHPCKKKEEAAIESQQE